MTPNRLERALLLGRTIRNLRAAQVLHRARLRTQRFPPSRPMAAWVIGRLPVKRRSAVGWPAAFTPLDLQLSEGCPRPEDNAFGRFTFLNEGRDLGHPVCWNAPGASRLWKYHLHYMEWLWSLASHPDRPWARGVFVELWRSWERAVPFGRGDEWSPYVASLRAWVLCGVYESLVAGSDTQPDVDASLARHARFLRWHVEHDVGGNHVIKNLKALIGLGVFFGDERLFTTAVTALARQLPIQVLSDGGHYERSPSYHCQVLSDFIDVAGLFDAAERPPVPGLVATIHAMRMWLGIMIMPDGDVPLFNDCVLVGRPRLSLLEPGPPTNDRLTALRESGYVVMRPDDRLHLVADVGDPCPANLPAHAHADCLTFELSVNAERLVVDSGTSTYVSGAQRAHERSTAAHNTILVDGADQTEVWGTFRAARLARGTLERADDDGNAVTVTASHDGYRRLTGGPLHRRTWSVTPAQVEITDEILGAGHHRLESRVHLSGGAADTVAWLAPPDVRVTEAPAKYATGFGCLRDGQLVSAAWEGGLPVTMRMKLVLEESALQGSEHTEDVRPMKGTK